MCDWCLVFLTLCLPGTPVQEIRPELSGCSVPQVDQMGPRVGIWSVPASPDEHMRTTRLMRIAVRMKRKKPESRCSGLQSSSVLLANIRDFCSDYLRMTGPECSRSLRTCSHSLRRACNHRCLLTLAAVGLRFRRRGETAEFRRGGGQQSGVRAGAAALRLPGEEHVHVAGNA